MSDPILLLTDMKVGSITLMQMLMEELDKFLVGACQFHAIADRHIAIAGHQSHKICPFRLDFAKMTEDLSIELGGHTVARLQLIESTEFESSLLIHTDDR